jgi:hypothetical protein
VSIGAGETRRSIMPTWLDWLRARRGAWRGQFPGPVVNSAWAHRAGGCRASSRSGYDV